MGLFRKFKEYKIKKSIGEENYKIIKNAVDSVYSGKLERDIKDLNEEIKVMTDNVMEIRRWIAERRQELREQLREQGVDVEQWERDLEQLRNLEQVEQDFNNK